MPVANVRNVELNYEIVGSKGPWLALMPGGRRGYKELIPLAGRIAEYGFRVLLHDRRNTGASQIAFDDSDAEDAIWADDLHALLKQLGALPAFVGGSSSGCRTSLLLYLRHREDVRGLLLMRVTGGALAAARLPETYYSQFIRAAEAGGMAAVAAMEHWQGRITERPKNREVIESTPTERFIAVMTAWRERFIAGVHMPVQGVSDRELRSIDVPTLVIPGNDRIHSSASGRHAHDEIPGAELHQLPISEADIDFVDYPEWRAYEPEIAAAFAGFMKQVTARPLA